MFNASAFNGKGLARPDFANGFNLYFDGVRVGGSSDVRPLNRTTIGWFANSGVDSLPTYGLFGWQMAFRGDLSDSVNTGATGLIDEIIKRRYGIA